MHCLRFYFWFIGTWDQIMTVQGFFAGVSLMFFLTLLILLAVDIYYLLLTWFFFKASNVILQLDLIYREKTDPSIYSIN